MFIFLAHNKCLTSLAYSSDCKTFASSSEDCTVKIWNAISFE